MAVPILPALKKLAVGLATDKKGRNWLIGIVCGIVFLILMPIMAVLSIFSGSLDVDMNAVLDKVYQQQTQMESVALEIEEEMRNAGFSTEQMLKAQALYLLALQDEGEKADFVTQLVACFQSEQTDEELVDSVNAVFGTKIKTQELIRAVEELKATQVSNE